MSRRPLRRRRSGDASAQVLQHPRLYLLPRACSCPHGCRHSPSAPTSSQLLFAAPRRASFSAAWGRVAGRTGRVPRECPPATRPAWRRRESARYTLVHPLTESSRKSRTRRAPSRRPGAQQSMTPSTAQPRRPARRRPSAAIRRLRRGKLAARGRVFRGRRRDEAGGEAGRERAAHAPRERGLALQQPLLRQTKRTAQSPKRDIAVLRRHGHAQLGGQFLALELQSLHPGSHRRRRPASWRSNHGLSPSSLISSPCRRSAPEATPSPSPKGRSPRQTGLC